MRLRVGLCVSLALAGLLWLTTSGNALAGWWITCGGKRYFCETTGCTCASFQSNSSAQPSSSGYGSSGSGSGDAAKYQQIQGAVQGIINILDQHSRDQERLRQQREQQERLEQLRQAQQEQERRQQFARMEQEFEQRRQQMLAESGGKANGNPWAAGGAGGSGSSEGDGDQGAGSAFEPPDPDADHSGSGCAYFTCPLMRADGGGMNRYAPGAFVVYGKYAYECRAGSGAVGGDGSGGNHWVKRGPASAWLSAGEKNRAENLEKGCR